MYLEKEYVDLMVTLNVLLFLIQPFVLEQPDTRHILFLPYILINRKNRSNLLLCSRDSSILLLSNFVTHQPCLFAAI